MRTSLTTSRIVAALAAGALALSACGGDDDSLAPGDPTTTASDPGLPAGDDQAAGGTRPADQEFEPQQRADMLFGLTEAEAQNIALEFGWTIRTGRVDDEQYMLTEDYAIDRITVEYDTPEDGGDAVATVVTIELEGGPETYRAP